MRYPLSPSPRQGDSASSKPIASLILKRAPIGPNPDEIICANLRERCHRLLASARSPPSRGRSCGPAAARKKMRPGSLPSSSTLSDRSSDAPEALQNFHSARAERPRWQSQLYGERQHGRRLRARGLSDAIPQSGARDHATDIDLLHYMPAIGTFRPIHQLSLARRNFLRRATLLFVNA
jgi:hypothetical protein